ncbi:hypothetical protein [Cellulomonas palmilytica]|uniref:hypothetical protein n=1 Tax=Cellulomonas palmilytica TaxID=2608402 RepID=UPI001F42370B|nr:hypothetical protein [Cellulomonas palmilytica]UJP40408.1 hypothetical protein F1D97_02440 [Cellulomonas palmilytica]
MIPFGLALSAGVLAAWQVRRLRRRGQRGALLLTTGGLVVGFVVLGIAAWHWQQGRAAYLTLVLAFVVATLLGRSDEPEPHPESAPPD